MTVSPAPLAGPPVGVIWTLRLFGALLGFAALATPLAFVAPSRAPLLGLLILGLLAMTGVLLWSLAGGLMQPVRAHALTDADLVWAVSLWAGLQRTALALGVGVTVALARAGAATWFPFG